MATVTTQRHKTTQNILDKISESIRQTIKIHAKNEELMRDDKQRSRQLKRVKNSPTLTSSIASLYSRTNL